MARAPLWRCEGTSGRDCRDIPPPRILRPRKWVVYDAEALKRRLRSGIVRRLAPHSAHAACAAFFRRGMALDFQQNSRSPGVRASLSLASDRCVPKRTAAVARSGLRKDAPERHEFCASRIQLCDDDAPTLFFTAPGDSSSMPGMCSLQSIPRHHRLFLDFSERNHHSSSRPRGL
jgi:hypothetical protein